jgi:hypothetical protein
MSDFLYFNYSFTINYFIYNELRNSETTALLP